MSKESEKEKEEFIGKMVEKLVKILIKTRDDLEMGIPRKREIVTSIIVICKSLKIKPTKEIKEIKEVIKEIMKNKCRG